MLFSELCTICGEGSVQQDTAYLCTICGKGSVQHDLQQKVRYSIGW